MPECEQLKDCPYFQNAIFDEIDGMREVRQQKYCRGDNSMCARYMIFKALGKEYVPKNLLPSQVEEAKKIIEQNKQSITNNDK
jgi:hypothetical protein